MNLGMSASTIRMPFLSKNFNFFKKKFQLNEKASKSFFKGTSLCHFKSQQRTIKIKESVLSNQFYQFY